MASVFKQLRALGIVFGASMCCAQYGSGVWEAFANHPATVEARERNERRRPVCSYRLSEAERLVEQNPRDERAWETIGRCKLQSGLTDHAVAAFRRILRANPDSADAFSLLGHALLQQGDREDAREMFEAALRMNPIEDQAYRGLGAYQAIKGATREAIENYETALKLATRVGPNLFSPDDDYRTVAFQYLKLGNPKLTVAAFQRAAEVFLIDSEINYQFGLALLAVGEHEKACAQVGMIDSFGDPALARQLKSRLDAVQ